MKVTKAIFSCDLRDFQHPFVLCDILSNCRHYVSFRQVTRHVLVASIARSKDCRNTRIIERGKRYVILFIFVFIYRNVYNQRQFCFV